MLIYCIKLSIGPEIHFILVSLLPPVCHKNINFPDIMLVSRVITSELSCSDVLFYFTQLMNSILMYYIISDVLFDHFGKEWCPVGANCRVDVLVSSLPIFETIS